jgi:hypothetical protein
MEIAHDRANKKPIVPPGKISGFRCAYRTSMSEFDDGGLYLAQYEGDLFVFLDDDREEGLDDSEQMAGQARLFVLNADAAENDGESLLDLLDRRAETAAYIPLLGGEAGSFSPAVSRPTARSEVRACGDHPLRHRMPAGCDQTVSAAI